MENKELANYPWVFWFQVSYRPKWFSYNWCMGSQLYRSAVVGVQDKYREAVAKIAIDSHVRDYGSAKYVHNTNQDNLKQRFSFICKSPKNGK